MLVQNTKFAHRLPGVSFLLAAALLLSMFATSPASAARSICRTDPTILLSNGTVLDLSAIVATSSTNIDNVLYVLHAPTGVSATLVVYSDIVPKINEKLVLVNDSVGQTYSTETTVTLKDKTVIPAQATSTKGLLIKTADGFTGQAIKIDLGSGSLK